MAKKSELLQGSLDLLILKTIALQPLHGWAISKRIRQLSRDALEVGQGSLYPALYRLKNRGLIRADLAESEEGRPIKVYSLTAAGRRSLDDEQQRWRRFADGVEAVLAAT